MSAKLYRLNTEIFNKMIAEVAKLPKQQQIILKTMSENCVETGMKGSDVIDLAKKSYGLETRQKSTVLYAWYARSNETFGVYLDKPAVTVAPVAPAKPAQKSDTKTK